MEKHLNFVLLNIFLTIICLLGVQNIYAQQTTSLPNTNAAETIRMEAEALASDPVFSQALVGICVTTADGKEIASINPKKMLLPASNMKLISTGAALKHFGSDYKFTTSIAYDGTIIDGTLHGDIYIVGGGDPTTGSKDSIANPLERTFAQWHKSISKAGIKKIEGHIVGDGRWFEGPSEEQSWLWEDLGNYYGSGTCGLMFYENMISFSATPGQTEGAPIEINPSYPDTPWMTFRYNCSTGKKGTGDQLYMFTTDLAPVAEIRGTLGMDKGRKRIDCSNKFPEYTCAKYFADYLEKKGVNCTKGPADFRLTSHLGKGTPAENLSLICQTHSPSLDRIAFETNHISNNVFAETLIRQLGKEMTGSAEYPQSIEALEDVLSKELGLDMSKGIRIKDGSGLSKGNFVSPDFLCRFLKAMMKTDNFNDFLKGLPRPGGNGSLYFNMKKYPDIVKNRIRMKSGSMTGVRCYSGYILPSSGNPQDIIIFSVMVNNCTSPNWKVIPMLDAFIAKVAGCN